MRPLAGIKVVDLTTMVSGPVATMMLADQGAEVIKVETLQGEQMRFIGPPHNGVPSAYFSCNRGKKSLSLDLKSDEGKEVLLKLIETADVFVQNFRPGAIERMGFSEYVLRKINEKLSAFQAQYKGNESVKDMLEKAKELTEQFSEIEKALYQTKNRSGQDPLNFPIRLTNKLGHLNSLVSMGDFAPTEQDIAVKNELSQKINAQLSSFNKLVDEEISAFNAAFNQKNLNYLFVED